MDKKYVLTAEQERRIVAALQDPELREKILQILDRPAISATPK